MSALTFHAQDGHYFLFDPAWFADIQVSHFSASHWRAQDAIIGQATGRGTTFFVRHRQGDLVLRHYRRGGIPGKVLSDQYLFTGLERTRPWRELKLLSWMQSQDLPVPSPVAAHVHRQGVIYRGDILLSMIAGSRDVHQYLCEKPLTAEIWHDIGNVIGKMHALQVHHDDLNIHNLLLDAQGKVWLIDFDRCGRRAGHGWKRANLKRLRRSLDKERGLHPSYHFAEDDWQALMQGYLAQ